MRLPVTRASFQAANGRPWLVEFWQLEGRWVGIAFPFGLVLFILFYFDHNVSVSLNLGLTFFTRRGILLMKSLLSLKEASFHCGNLRDSTGISFFWE